MPLKKIVDLLLKLNVGGYSIEAANPRHEHEWKVWMEVKLPEGGCYAGRRQPPDQRRRASGARRRRLVRFANVVGRDHVIAGTDCGFAQGPFVRRVHESTMWAKLESLVEGARLASEALWGRTSSVQLSARTMRRAPAFANRGSPGPNRQSGGALDYGPSLRGEMFSAALRQRVVGTRRFSASSKCWTTIRVGAMAVATAPGALIIRKRWPSVDTSYVRPTLAPRGV